MPTETFPFDPARYLQTDEERATYLAEAIETNDPDFIADALEVVARSRDTTLATTSGDQQADAGRHNHVDLEHLLQSMRQLGLRLTVRSA